MSGARPVVVDDNNSQITYQGSWFTDARTRDSWVGYGPPLGNTMHVTQSSGSLSFSLSGTYVEVVGPNDRNRTDLAWKCFLDNIEIPRGGSSSALAACFHDNLVAGPHTLTVNVTITATNETFFFDRIQYTPIPTTTLENQLAVVGSIHTSNKSVLIGAILGSIFGSFFAITVGIIVYLWWRKNRRLRREDGHLTNPYSTRQMGAMTAHDPTADGR